MEGHVHRDVDFKRITSIRVGGEWINVVAKNRKVFSLTSDALPDVNAEFLLFNTPDGHSIAIRPDLVEAFKMNFSF